MKTLPMLVSVIVGALMLASCRAHSGSFALVNHASEPIAHASVSICGQTIELRDIQSGRSATRSYRVTSDSHYGIRVEFGSGKQLYKEVGYVTNGVDFQHEISVTDSDIEITATQVK